MTTIEEYKTELENLRDSIKELKDLYELRQKEYTDLQKYEKLEQHIKNQYLAANYIVTRVIKDLEELLK